METASIVSKPDGRGSADGSRSQLRRMWGSVAGGWEEHAAYADTGVRQSRTSCSS